MTTEPTPEPETVMVDFEFPTLIVEKFLVSPVRVKYEDGETDWSIGIVAYDHDAIARPDVAEGENAEFLKPTTVIAIDGRMAVEMAHALLDTFLDGPPKAES